MLLATINSRFGNTAFTEPLKMAIIFVFKTVQVQVQWLLERDDRTKSTKHKQQ
jgi:hypothetical protein